VRLSSAQSDYVTGADLWPGNREVGTGFSFYLRLPESTYEGQYVRKWCGGLCGHLYPSAPFAADGMHRVTGTPAVAADQ